MPIFAMLLFIALLGVAVVLAIGWFVSLGFFIGGRKKQSRSQTWFAGVPLVLISGLGLWLSYLVFAPPNAANAYQELFGVAPSQDVTEMRAYEDGVGDNRQVYLRFNASPATIKRITAKDWYKEDADDWAKHGGETLYNDDAPNWWRPKKTSQTQVFGAAKRLGQFSTDEMESLIYDSGTRKAYYRYDGMD